MTSLFEVLLPLQLESLSQERAWQIWRPTVLCNYAKKCQREEVKKGRKSSLLFLIYVKPLIHKDLIGNYFVKWHPNSCNCQQQFYSWHQFPKTSPVKSSTVSISYYFSFFFECRYSSCEMCHVGTRINPNDPPDEIQECRSRKVAWLQTLESEDLCTTSGQLWCPESQLTSPDNCVWCVQWEKHTLKALLWQFMRKKQESAKRRKIIHLAVFSRFVGFLPFLPALTKGE